MPRLSPIRLSPTLLCLLLAACDCGSNELPSRRCTTSAECSGAETCVDGVCLSGRHLGGLFHLLRGLLVIAKRVDHRLEVGMTNRSHMAPGPESLYFKV